jgi:hypothetical protein
VATESEWLVLEGRARASLADKAALALALAQVEVLPSVLSGAKMQECGDEEYVEFNMSPRNAVGRGHCKRAADQAVCKARWGDAGRVQAKKKKKKAG